MYINREREREETNSNKGYTKISVHNFSVVDH